MHSPLVSPPLQVYHRSNDRQVVPYGPEASSSLSEVHSPPPSTDDLPIALRKGPRTCTQHPLAHFVSYHRLSPCFHSFVCALSSVSIPSSYEQAQASSGWRQAMDEEIKALYDNKTWELTVLPPGKPVVGCHWVYTIKFLLDGFVERL